MDFWTYSCINCLRTLPYIRAWAEKYKDSGLVVIGVHAPEFAFEKDLDNVKQAVRELKITYPVAIDNDCKIWNGFSNSYWPADYLIDATGRIRHHHFGEGKYDETEQQIQTCSRNAMGSWPSTDSSPLLAPVRKLRRTLMSNRPKPTSVMSAPTAFFLPAVFAGVPFTYSIPPHLELNQWGLAGTWTDRPQVAALKSAPGKIVFRFHARDLHLVLGPAARRKAGPLPRQAGRPSAGNKSRRRYRRAGKRGHYGSPSVPAHSPEESD